MTLLPHVPKLLDKMYKYEMDPTRTVGATEQTRDAGRTDGLTDGRSETNIPLTTSLCGGIINCATQECLWIITVTSCEGHDVWNIRQQLGNASNMSKNHWLFVNGIHRGWVWIPLTKASNVESVSMAPHVFRLVWMARMKKCWTFKHRFYDYKNRRENSVDLHAPVAWHFKVGIKWQAQTEVRDSLTCV